VKTWREKVVVATGVDIIEVRRIRAAMERWGDRFLRRVFTPGEINHCRRKSKPELSFAARYAAKEAVLKALGIGLRGGLSWKDVEIINNERGAPMVKPGQPMMELLGEKRLLISLSHLREMAAAVALLVDDRGEQG
jgi:holo-[acyl-carrier protein] synthase